jgi:2-keto-4-pentenoate hydratase/2-oxohepta-3-ene-1,7-dioic acid hydratase in catechol pathway
MKLITYLAAGGPARAGALLRNDRVLDLEGAAQSCGMVLPPTVLDLLDLGANGLETAAKVVAEADRADLPTLPLAQVRLLAPLPRPRKVLAIAGNYAAHVAESKLPALEKEQTTIRPFMKPSNSVIGPNGVVRFPKWSTTVDYEAELAIVIGRTATAVSAADAPDYIAGYSVFNDISARTLTIDEKRSPREGDRFYDWLAGKWFDTFAAFGPAITTVDDVPDPHALALSLTVNGQQRQRASTADMLYNCYEIVSFLSHLTTLEAGDMIATGTPSGVGSATGTFLQPGDVIEATIETLGTLRISMAVD